MKLQGKAAVVPGGGSVFGAGIVRKFVAEGARVVVADLNLDAAQTVAAAAGDAACAVRADVASAADTHAMLEAAPRLTAHVPGSGDLRGATLNRASTAGVSPRQRRRAGALRHPRQRAEPGGRRDPAAEDLHGRGHARDAREVPLHHPDRPLLHPRGPGQCRLLPVQRRGQPDHRRVHGSRRRALHPRA